MLKDNELKEIEGRLKKWRELRRLDTKGQQKGLIGNILEELTEYARANDKIEQIDALCDIAIFCLNAADNIDKNLIIEAFSIDIEHIYIFLAFFKDEKLFNKLIINIFNVAVKLIDKKGFNPYKCILETVEEISSRTGYWDESKGKFIKDNKGTYRANYEACKYINV